MTSVKERPFRDNPERLYQQLGQLVETVDQAYEQQRAVHELERDLFRQLLAMGYQLLDSCVLTYSK